MHGQWGVAPLLRKSNFCEPKRDNFRNGTSKNVGLGKFGEDLEVSEAFFDKSRNLVFAWFVFTFSESLNFLPKSLGLGFLTRILASRRVSDFTIRHPYCYLSI